MATLTYQAQLEEVQQAITGVLSGTLESRRRERSFHPLSLAQLEKREAKLRYLVKLEAGTAPPSARSVVMRRRDTGGRYETW